MSTPPNPKTETPKTDDRGPVLLDYRATTDPRKFVEHVGIRVLAAHVVKDGKYQHGQGEPLVLLPGVQRVDQKAWDDVKASGGAKELLASNQLRVLPRSFDLGKVSFFEAEAYVKRTIDAQVLTEWRDQVIGASYQPQHKASILRAIDAQLKEVTTDLKGATITQQKPRLLGDNEVVMQ